MSSRKTIAVVNTSPLIYLSAIGHLNILKSLFSEVFIPHAVREEILRGTKRKTGIKEIEECKWIKTKRIKNKMARDMLMTDIDKGEAEVIVLAEEIKADFVVMDDKLGRKIAKLRGFKVVGTLRVLIGGKEKGIIEKVGPLVEQLEKAGFWVSEDVKRFVLKIAGEL